MTDTITDINTITDADPRRPINEVESLAWTGDVQGAKALLAALDLDALEAEAARTGCAGGFGAALEAALEAIAYEPDIRAEGCLLYEGPEPRRCATCTGRGVGPDSPKCDHAGADANGD